MKSGIPVTPICHGLERIILETMQSLGEFSPRDGRNAGRPSHELGIRCGREDFRLDTVAFSIKDSIMLQRLLLLFGMALVSGSVHGAILFQEDFEDANLAGRGFIDIAKWGEDKSLSIAGPPEIKANTGQ